MESNNLWIKDMQGLEIKKKKENDWVKYSICGFYLMLFRYYLLCNKFYFYIETL